MCVCSSPFARFVEQTLSSQHARTTGQFDLLFGLAGEQFRLDDDGSLGKVSGTEQLEVTEFHQINHGDLLGVLLGLSANFLRHQSPQLGEVERRAELVVAVQVEVPHTDLTEVTGMVLIVVDTMMVHTTSVTATTRMLAVLANTTVTVADMATQLPGLLPFP